MLITVEDCQLELVQGDITRQEVDVIVNAANSDLALSLIHISEPTRPY